MEGSHLTSLVDSNHVFSPRNRRKPRVLHENRWQFLLKRVSACSGLTDYSVEGISISFVSACKSSRSSNCGSEIEYLKGEWKSRFTLLRCDRHKKNVNDPANWKCAAWFRINMHNLGKSLGRKSDKFLSLIFTNYAADFKASQGQST